MGDSTPTVTSWSNSVLKFLCPNLDSGSYDFVVDGPDNSDTIVDAFYVLPLIYLIIDSISPIRGKRNSTILYYCTDLIDSSASVRAKLNALNMSITKWRNAGIKDTVAATIPGSAPRGFYWPHIDTISGSDTIPLDTSLSRYRVLVPEIITDGNTMIVGQKYTFQWKDIEDCTIMLSRNGKVDWEVVQANVITDLLYPVDPDTICEYEWTITGPASADCYVKFIDNSDASELVGDQFEIEAYTCTATLKGNAYYKKPYRNDDYKKGYFKRRYF